MDQPIASPVTRLAYRTIGTAALGLAVTGLVLPGLPATPFLLLAVWAFNRSSPEMAKRLELHPRLGPLLRNWRDRRVVPLKAKILAARSMIASFSILWPSSAPLLVLITVGTILCTVATYLFSRPSA